MKSSTSLMFDVLFISIPFISIPPLPKKSKRNFQLGSNLKKSNFKDLLNNEQ